MGPRRKSRDNIEECVLALSSGRLSGTDIHRHNNNNDPHTDTDCDEAASGFQQVEGNCSGTY